jgi:hypothetical protein
MASLFYYSFAMLSTKNIFEGLNEVPNTWIFEHYLNLNESLTGQDVKLFSVFRHEKTPSMYVYYSKSINDYRFKDFSTGYHGDGKNMVMRMYNLTFAQTVNKITVDYTEYLKNQSPTTSREFKVHDKYKVVDYEMKHWNNLDQSYWSKFKISSKMLDRYNVVPLKFFNMQKVEEDDSVNSILFEYNHIYGYFRDDGVLYKIYSPKNVAKKFIKVTNYIQGLNQLTYTADYLIITSSLKDLMCFNVLGIKNIEAIAPDSENSMIRESDMVMLRSKYKKIITLFDNDEAGIASMEKYKQKYSIDYIILDMEKDLSDSVNIHGIEAVRDKLFPLLKQIL